MPNYPLDEQPQTRTQEQWEQRERELQQALDASRRETREAREQTERKNLELVVRDAQKPIEKLGTGSARIVRDKAIVAVGGLAKWNQLSENERLKVLRQAPAIDAEIAAAREHFGPSSSSLKAAQLAKNDPKLYSRLRAIAIEYGFGPR